MTTSNHVNYYPARYAYSPTVRQDYREPFATGEAIIQELRLFPKSRALIDEVRKELQESGLPNLEIRLEQTTSGFEAEQEKNIISILPGLSASKQLSNAVFELHNVLANRKFIAVEKAAKNGSYKSAEEYAKALEYTEFEGKISCMNQITKEINQHKAGMSNRPYIENSYERCPDNMEFDQFYKLIPEDHKEYYRKHWINLNSEKEARSLSPKKEARSVNPDWRSCCSSKITYAAVTCTAIAIAVLGLSKMI